jgi:hypothetical protein
MYISNHKITPEGNENIVVSSGFVVLKGEQFIIYDAV